MVGPPEELREQPDHGRTKTYVVQESEESTVGKSKGFLDHITAEVT